MQLTTLKKTVVLSWLCLLASILAGCETKSELVIKAPQVRYITVVGERVLLEKELPGRVSAYQVSEVRPQVGGIIKERLFEEGADVTAGQVLYKIDPALFQTAYNNAKANLTRAEANLVSARLLAQRYGSIVKTNAVSRQEHDDAVAAHAQARAEVDAAREALEEARINLSYTEVTAPVSGRIGRSFVTPGALVTQNQPDPLATVQQLSPVYVDVTQPSTELLRLRRAMSRGELTRGNPDEARIRLKLEDGSPYARNADNLKHNDELQWIEGVFLFSDVTIEQSTGVVTIRATFENPETVLLPGMYVRAVLQEGVLESAVLAPQKAVTRDTRGRAMVHVLTKISPDPDPREHAVLAGDEYYVAARPVTVDRALDNRWLISSGLEPGDLLLVDGLQKARPGDVVAGLALEPETLLSSGHQENDKTRW